MLALEDHGRTAMADMQAERRVEAATRDRDGTDLVAFLGEAPEPQSDLPAWLLPAELRGDGGVASQEAYPHA